MSELFKADNEYKEWIAGISTDFRRSQIRDVYKRQTLYDVVPKEEIAEFEELMRKTIAAVSYTHLCLPYPSVRDTGDDRCLHARGEQNVVRQTVAEYSRSVPFS